MERAINRLKREAEIMLNEALSYAGNTKISAGEKDQLVAHFTERGQALMYAVGVLQRTDN